MNRNQIVGRAADAQEKEAGRALLLSPRDGIWNADGADRAVRAAGAACGLRLEIENCRSILQYDAEKLKLDMGELSVTIEGNELVVDTYQKTLITVRGQVFSIHFGYGGVQGG